MFDTSRGALEVCYGVLDMMVTLTAMQFERFFCGFNNQICVSSAMLAWSMREGARIRFGWRSVCPEGRRYI
jgi:hypothetical protein